MPSAFHKANQTNQVTIKNLRQLIINLDIVKKLENGKLGWQDVPMTNYFRINRLFRNKHARPTEFNINKHIKNLKVLEGKFMTRRWAYGYVPKQNASWTLREFTQNGRRVMSFVPSHIPQKEIKNFLGYKYIIPGLTGSKSRGPFVINKSSRMSSAYRKQFANEGTLKMPMYGPRRKPSPAKPRPVLPTLQELSWNAYVAHGKTPVNIGFNVNQLKPSPREKKNNRNNAARKIQSAVRAYQKKVSANSK